MNLKECIVIFYSYHIQLGIIFWQKKKQNHSVWCVGDKSSSRATRAPARAMLAPGVVQGGPLGTGPRPSKGWGEERPPPLSPGLKLVMGCLGGVWDFVEGFFNDIVNLY